MYANPPPPPLLPNTDDADDEIDQLLAIPNSAQPLVPPGTAAVPHQPLPQPVAGVVDLLAGGAADAETSVKLKHFVGLLVAAERVRGSRAPRDHFVVRAVWEGEARRDAVFFRCSLRVCVIGDARWFCAPLFSTAVAVTTARVKLTPKPPLKAPSSASPSVSTPLDDLLTDAASVSAPTTTKTTTTTASAVAKNGTIGVVGEWYCLIGSRSGEYDVDVELLVPYATSRRTGAHFNVPKASQNEMRFVVPQPDVLIKIDPSLFSAPMGGDAERTTVQCLLPPTSAISVNWTDKVDVEGGTGKAEKAKEKVVASVDQSTLVSIGEGVLVSTTHLAYKVVTGQMSMFVVELDPRVRVLHCDGNKAIPVRNWEVEKAPAMSSFYSDPDDKEKPQAQYLRAWLEYGVEDAFELKIVSELPLDPATQFVRLPNFACVAQCEAHQITREKGFVVVEARTNVEVRESGLPRRISRVAPDELPEQLCDKEGVPPLLAYKFLAPTYVASIGIQKHQDASVLVAAIDNAHFSATVSP
jgi:hypothetical protein